MISEKDIRMNPVLFCDRCGDCIESEWFRLKVISKSGSELLADFESLQCARDQLSFIRDHSRTKMTVELYENGGLIETLALQSPTGCFEIVDDLLT